MKTVPAFILHIQRCILFVRKITKSAAAFWIYLKLCPSLQTDTYNRKVCRLCWRHCDAVLRNSEHADIVELRHMGNILIRTPLTFCRFPQAAMHDTKKMPRKVYRHSVVTAEESTFCQLKKKKKNSSFLWPLGVGNESWKKVLT